MLPQIERGHGRRHVALGILALDVGGRLRGHPHRHRLAAPVDRSVRGGRPFDGDNRDTRLGHDCAARADERQRDPEASHHEDAYEGRLVRHPDCSFPWSDPARAGAARELDGGAALGALPVSVTSYRKYTRSLDSATRPASLSVSPCYKLLSVTRWLKGDENL